MVSLAWWAGRGGEQKGLFLITTSCVLLANDCNYFLNLPAQRKFCEKSFLDCIKNTARPPPHFLRIYNVTKSDRIFLCKPGGVAVVGVALLMVRRRLYIKNDKLLSF